MGSWFSKEEIKIDEKVVDTNGAINNNIILREVNDTHSQMLINQDLLYATYFLCLIEAIKLAIYLFNAYKKHVKKQYSRNGGV